MKQFASLLAFVLLSSLGSRAQHFILGAELSNSAATSIADIDSVIPKVARAGINTVLVPAQWDLIEPREGVFDFSTIDETIRVARHEKLKVILLWFGAWKNSMSCYAPLWFKQDKRFPRAMTAEGKPLEIATAFSEAVFQADNKAFMALIHHLKAVDTDRTVLMIQIENEIGMLESARDHSPLANREYDKGAWRKELKSIGFTAENEYEDEAFQAIYYAKYVERLAVNAKKVIDLSLFVNAAMNSRGRKPGEYPSAGPLAHLKTIWKKFAPHIDLMAPDIYDTGFAGWAAQYDFKDNPLFIPESRSCRDTGVRALYTFGAHNTVGFSCFALDHADAETVENVRQGYALLRQLRPLLTGNLKHHGLLFGTADDEKIIHEDDFIITSRHYFTLPWDPRAKASTWPEAGGMIIRLDKGDYLIAGNGLVMSFQTETEHRQHEEKKLGEDGFAEKGNENKAKKPQKTFTGKRAGIGFVDEVEVLPDGNLRYLRRLNGDEDHQGRHARITVGDWKVLHVKLYTYE